jgi:fibronectin-binding autotransporter adhesin
MDRYWVGGAGTWDATTTTNWATSSGGAGGASAPTSADNVIFDSLSNATAYTVTVGTNAVCADLTAAGPLVGNVTFSLAATARIDCYGSFTLAATGITWTGVAGALVTFRATTTGKTITTNGVSITLTALVFNGVGGEWTLGSALTLTVNSAQAIDLQRGTFKTGNYNITSSAGGIRILATGDARAMELGSSTITLANTSGVWNTQTPTTNFTFDAGTSTITTATASPTFNGGGLTFYNVSFTSTAIANATINGANTFNDLTFAARAAAGTGSAIFGADQTVNGTLTLGSGTSGVARLWLRTPTTGVGATLTVATLAAPTDIDFRDITAAGASSPWSGTRLGNCLGNSNITFDAGKTVYWNLAAGGNWNSAAWATTSGGSAATTNYPLAQDTAIIEDTGLNTSATIGVVPYNTGTIDMSSRTNAMTFNSGTLSLRVYGNLIFSSAVTSIGASGFFVFHGQGITQQLTTAGVVIAAGFIIENATGTLQLQDNCVSTSSNTGSLTLTSGTLDLNEFNLSTNGRLTYSGENPRSIDFGSAGKIYLAYDGGATFTIINSPIVTNFTIAGTSHIEANGNNTSGARTFALGGSGGFLLDGSNAPNIYISAGTDTININSFIGTLDFTGFSGTFSNGTATRRLYGDLVLSSTMTFSGGTASFIFDKESGTQTVTTNGIVVDAPIQVGVTNSPTLELQDNMTIGSTRTFTFTNGTLDLNDKVLTTGSVSTSNSNTRSIDFGRNGVINCEGAFTATTATGLTTAGRGRIKMSSASAKTFAGGGANYSAAALEQAGAGTLTITGANTFDDITNSNATASQITFPANTTTSVRKLSVSGSSGNLVSLRSSTDGTKFTIQTV